MTVLQIRISLEHIVNTKGNRLGINKAKHISKFKRFPVKMLCCCLCRQKHNSLKKLHGHYLSAHSKGKIARQLLKSQLLRATPNVISGRRLTEKVRTIYMSEELSIQIRRNEIVLKDCKEDMQFKFLKNPNEKNKKSRKKQPKRNVQRPKLDIFQTARLDIIPLQDSQSLDDKFGDFYICKCRKPRSNARKANLTILTSDVESCSEGGNRKCKQCGNMYRTHNKLIEHLYLHLHLSDALVAEQGRISFTVYACHICNMEFPLDNLLYRHFQWHQENTVLEDFVGLQDDYTFSHLSDRTFNANHAGNLSEFLFSLDEFY